ncbi:hypothetical protein N7495_007190 [Penicillium taxi]|uniref:uncharacterized protein n=1 Tax=Penicillium taxi TaxID=168475 RepID=UPI0025455C9E|nr:uncharacterized protein N7495_007190 [Penicillium taxi]KAJ5895499.1 hypothetical protein N7495_007190 [Penicillium taxi]
MPLGSNDPFNFDGEVLSHPILIIGAGISGIAAGCQVKRKFGITDFVIFDKNSDIGGTWLTHRYPGVACDVPAALYSFSFAPNYNWSTLKPLGEEIWKYLLDVCAQYHLSDNIRLNTEVTELQWDEETLEWEVKFQHLPSLRKGIIYAKIVLTAVGKFAKPKTSVDVLRDVDGIQDFQSDIIHTSEWKNSVDVHKKNVLVLGTGCSAAQVVPRLLGKDFGAASVTQLMRSPPWVAPNHLSKRHMGWWKIFMPFLTRNIPGVALLVRVVIFAITETSYFRFTRPGRNVQTRRAERAKALISHMRSKVPSQYHQILMPQYEVGCKRLIHDDGWFDSLHDPKMKLSTLPLQRLGPREGILGDMADRITIPLDTIILATGYDTSALLQPMRIIGRNMINIHELWKKRGGQQAYMGVALDGFPNLFFLFGPNSSSGHTSVIIGIENAINYILQIVKPIIEGQAEAYEVEEAACKKWTDTVQSSSGERAWVNGGCTSWWIDESKWNGMIYP